MADVVNAGPEVGFPTEEFYGAASGPPKTNDVVLAEIEEDSGPEIPELREPKATPPSLIEWNNFFGKVVIRFSCDWYVSWAFRGIDEELLTDREVERLRLTQEERAAIARPLAEVSNKSKFMRKHGRKIVSSADAFQGLVIFGAWTSRVNRIAAKYRKANRTAVMANVEENNNGYPGPGAPTGDVGGIQGTTGGRIPNGLRVVNPGSN